MKRAYQVTTSWRRAPNACGVSHAIERGECTADAMRLAREDVFERYGAVEITQQHAQEKLT